MTDLITKDSSQIHLGHSSFGSSLRTVAYSGLALLNLTAFLIQGCSKSLDPAPPKVTNYSVPVNVWLSANNPAWESSDPRFYINPEGGGKFDVKVQLEFSGKGDISPPLYLWLKACRIDGSDPYYTDIINGNSDCPVYVNKPGISTVYAGSASSGQLDTSSLMGHMLRVALASATPGAKACYDSTQVNNSDSVLVKTIDVSVTAPH